MLDHVLQLSDVARPAERGQAVQRCRLDAGEPASQARRQAAGKRRQQGDVLPPISQWWQMDGEYAEPIVQIVAEASALDRLFERPVGRGDQPDVDPPGLGGAQTLELALLEDPQQRHLHVEGELADFVEKERRAVGLLEAPDAPLAGTGEGAVFVAEQLGGNRAARELRPR